MDNRSTVEEVKAKLPIEEVIAAYVPLKKAGRIYKGLCPFHNEKTPSFTVNPERQIYKCFGCGEGGDIIAFVMKTEGLTFPEALKLLADKAGVPLPEYRGNDQPKGPSKSRLFSLNEHVATLWHKLLIGHEKAADARDYLKRRGLTSDSLETFTIGYAPPARATRETLQKAGFTSEEVRAAGDPTKFEDRIVFPIADITGRTVGFTGRLLEHPDDAQHPTKPPRGPKYWNSPETPLFVKSRTVYALHIAKHAIQEEGIAVLAEGQMDVVMLHQYGYRNTVASSGTALTDEQLSLLRRFAPAVAFAYDADKAGKAATLRGIELALKADLVPYVIPLPNGLDPADALLKDESIWQKAYSARQPYMKWIIGQLLPDGATNLSPEAKRQAAKELVTWLNRITDPTEQADWLRTVAAHLQTSEATIQELYRRLFPNQSLASSRTTAAPSTKASKDPVNLADLVLALLATFPEVYPHLRDELVPLAQAPSDPDFAPLKKLLSSDSLESALTTLTDEERTKIHLAAETTLHKAYDETEMSGTWALQETALILRRWRAQDREQEKSRIAAAIQQAQALGKTEEIQKLITELQNLI